MATIWTTSDDEWEEAPLYEYESPNDDVVEDRWSGDTTEDRLASALPASDDQDDVSKRGLSSDDDSSYRHGRNGNNEALVAR